MLRALSDGAVFAHVPTTDPVEVLALPGWMHAPDDFDASLAGLPWAGLHLPGFGGPSPEPPTSWTTADYADAVAGALGSLDLAGPLVVVGHSFGGRVAVHLAARRPDLVAALVLTGVPHLARVTAPGSAAKAPLGFRVVRALAKLGLASDARLEAARRTHGSADYAAASPVMRGVLVAAVGEWYDDVLAASDCPVELVWGSADTAAPLAEAQAAAAALGGRGALHVADGVGHLLPTAAPEALTAAVARALGRR